MLRFLPLSIAVERGGAQRWGEVKPH